MFCIISQGDLGRESQESCARMAGSVGTTESYPLLASPFQGAGPAGGFGEIVCEPRARLLPLSGGGWVGVSAGLDAASPSPLEGEVAPKGHRIRFANSVGMRGISLLRQMRSSAEERIPLTLTFLLNAKMSVPLPQGARGGWSR